ncbi:hypothetical protein GGI15_004894, partial [Coemansia interrupta]
MSEDQKSQAPTTRYSLRTRTPVKAPEPVPVPAPRTPTSRRRSRPSEAAQLAKTTSNKGSATKTRGRASSVPSTKRRTSAASRRTRATREQPSTPSTDNEDEDDDVDAAEQSSEDEEFSPDPESSTHFHKKRAMSTLSATTSRRGPGRPRGGKRSRADDSSSRSAWDTRRAPTNLTKHDPFKVENLAAAAHIMQQIPTKGLPNDDRYELMKMSDALKMCGFELGVPEPGTEHLAEIYRLLSWAVHASGPSGPSHPLPPLSEEAKGDLIRVFASIGRRIREETKDMAGYHRRHALRKLMLAKTARSESSMQEDGEARGNAVHRRNPLKIPGPLIDIWKVPYKKANGNDGN